MKVSGFTFIRNAVKFDYPIVEAITSILPICDEFIVAVGNSEDSTKQLIENIGSDKIKIIETVWDESLREGGRVLAVETDKAFAHISSDSDWAFYIQGDEVVHEKYLDSIKEAMLKYKDDKKVEGLLLKYKHFYGSYSFIGDSRRWYRREVRIVRNDKRVKSYRDAQGFRFDKRLIRVKSIDAYMYHYGWVKPPEFQQAKQEFFHKLWHNDSWVEKNIVKADKFDYSTIDSIAHFVENHPLVMKKRVDNNNWQFDFDPTIKRFSFKNRILQAVEKKTGWRIGEYKNFKLI
ncbi:MAG: glycosyltransferase family 2 protein [Bacteroidota bacterium]